MPLRDHRTGDAQVLYCLRRRAILELCPPTLSVQQAQDWASKHTIESMTERLRCTEGWVDERGDTVAGWICLKADYIEGLYVDPDHAGKGVGSNLLRHLEEELIARGITSVRADASLNAIEFYLRRGYEPTGFHGCDGSLPLAKKLKITGDA